MQICTITLRQDYLPNGKVLKHADQRGMEGPVRRIPGETALFHNSCSVSGEKRKGSYIHK